MRIAITGSHKVGKTSLAELLHKRLSGYDLISEPYYEMLESGIIFSDIPGIDEFKEQLNYSIEQFKTIKKNVIFDRCPIDIAAYISASDKNENINTFKKLIEPSIKTLDILVFVPIENNDKIYITESDSLMLRNDVNYILNDIIWDFDIEIIEVYGTVTERTEIVLKYIS